ARFETPQGLGNLLAQAGRERVEPLLGLGQVGCLEDGAQLTRHASTQTLRHLGEDVPLQMHGTPLASRLGKLSPDGLNEAPMLVRDHELDAAKAALSELAQKLAPAVFTFLRPDAHPEKPAVAVGHDSISHQGRDILDRACPSGIQESRVQIKV